MVDTRDAGAVSGPQGQNWARAGDEPLEDMDTVIARLKAMMAAAEQAEAEQDGAEQAPAAAGGVSAPPAGPPQDTEHSGEIYEGAPPQPEGAEPEVKITTEIEVITQPVAAPLAQPLGAAAKGLADPLAPQKNPPTDAEDLSERATAERPDPAEGVLAPSDTPDHFDFG